MIIFNPFPALPPNDQPRQANRLDVQRDHLQHQRRYYQAQQDQVVRIDRQRPDHQVIDNAVINIRRWFGQALVNIGNWITPDATGVRQ